MARARLTDDVITLDTTYAETHLAKAVPGFRYHVRGDEHAAKAHFVYPLSWGTCVALRGVFRDALEVSPDLARWAQFELGLRIKPCLELRGMLELPADHQLAKRLDELGL